MAVTVPDPRTRRWGIKDTDSPVFGLTVAVRFTSKSNPPRGVTVTFEVAVVVGTMLTGLIGAIVKSGWVKATNVKVAVALWMTGPDVPVIVTS